MDLSQTTAPRSDQQNYDDYIGGPKTLTVDSVRAGNSEQPVEIHLVEFPGRPWKPSKSMRRVLVAAWGADGNAYAGRRLTLYGDPTVKFGGAPVGGIKVSHLSHIDNPITVQLTVTRGKRSPHKVDVLPDTSTPRPIPDDIEQRIDNLDDPARLAAMIDALNQHPDDPRVPDLTTRCDARIQQLESREP